MAFENKGVIPVTILVAASDSLNQAAANYICPGAADDVVVQEALDALPADGGKVVLLEGNYVFAATVTRAIDNITIEGQGRSTYLSHDAATPIFSSGGQSRWIFKNFATDLGGVTTTSLCVIDNIWVDNILKNSLTSILDYGLSFLGTVSGIVGAPNFQCDDLRGFGDNFFKNYDVYVVWDAAGGGAAPQGERLICTASTDAGDFTAPAFSAAIAVGDKVLLQHPLLHKIEVIQKHLHPDFNVTVPNGSYRYGAITFNSAANGETVTITTGGVGYVYTFVNALGAPAANNVEVKVQGTVALTAAKLAQAVRGITDVDNIAYGAGTQPNPGITAHYTGVRTSIGAIMHPASPTLTGPTVRFRERYQDHDETTYPISLADTTAHAGIYLLTDFIRTYQTRYTMSGNAAALGNRIAGCYHCLIPPYTVVDVSGRFVKYDSSVLVVEAISATNLLTECDLYNSIDEISFNYMSMGQELSREPLAAGSQEYHTRVPRVAEGYGLYCKMRSNGNAITDWVDIKIQIHTYPYGI